MGFGVGRENDRALDGDERSLAKPQREESSEVHDEGDVATPDGRHLDDLALDQLDPVVFAEDADLGYPIVFLAAEASSRRRRLYRH